MPSSFTFDRTAFGRDLKTLERAMREGSKKAMKAVIEQAVKDARAIDHWRNPGRHEEEYPSGVWNWEVTGLAKASISGYVVPDKNLPRLPRLITTSFHNGQPLQHPHYTDDGVTGNYADHPDRIQGVITMNAAYSPYLQAYETETAGEPVVIEVLAMNWDQAYVPRILVPVLDRALDQAVAALT